MSVAAIAIDNFLDTSKWNTIQAGISGYLNAPLYSENRTSLHTDINSWIKEKLSSLGLWNNLWEDDVKLLKTAVEEFKPLLRDGVREYLTTIQEDDLERVLVHKEQLKRKLNAQFNDTIRYSGEERIDELINANPVERVLLPSFTAQ